MNLRHGIEFALTVLAAASGGALFHYLGLPVAWLSGAMVVIAGLAMAGMRLRLPALVRDFGMMTAGLSLGATISPEAIATVQRYPWSLLGLAVSIVFTVAVSSHILQRSFGWDRATAFLASVPGALSMVMALAADSAGDVKRIAVVQAIRLFALVTVMPLAIRATNTPVVMVEHAVVGATGLAILYGLTIIANEIMLRLKFANPLFLGGMLAGSLMHITGLIQGELPGPLVIIGMVSVGTFAGMRFVGARPSEVLALIVPGLVVLTVALAISLVFALAVHWATGLRLAEVLVAFAPGGVEAMILMGAAMGLDTLYISSHHVLRSIALNLATPFFAPRKPRAD